MYWPACLSGSEKGRQGLFFIQDFQEFLFLHQIVAYHPWGRNVAHPYHVAFLTGVVIVKAFCFVQLFIRLQFSFLRQKVFAQCVFRLLDEKNPAGNGVEVVVETGLDSTQEGRPVVHGGFQADVEQGKQRRLAFVEADVKMAEAVHHGKSPMC